MNKKDLKVIMLGAGPLQVPAIKELKKMGITVCCFDYDPNAEGFKYADEHKIISTVDVESICKELIKETNFVLMTSTSDAPVRVISEVSEKLGIPCALSYRDACAVTIKSEMRKRLQEHHIAIPQFYVIDKWEKLKDVYRNFLKQNCIIKPTDSAGSRGVKLLEKGMQDDQLQSEYETCKKNSKNGIIIAEEIMDGPEVSVESLTINGHTDILNITDKVVCSRPYFVEIGHVEPSRLSYDIKKQIENITISAINAMNIKNGPSHTEIIVTEEGPKIVEIAARLGGDYITSKLVPLSTGVNMVEKSIQIALQQEVEYEIEKYDGAAIRFLGCDCEGTIKNIKGVDKALAVKGIYEVKIDARIGQKVKPLHSSNDRIGYIIAKGETAAQAWERVEKAYGYIQIEVAK